MRLIAGLTLWLQVSCDAHFCISEVTVQSQITQKLVSGQTSAAGLHRNDSSGSFLCKLFPYR